MCLIPKLFSKIYFLFLVQPFVDLIKSKILKPDFHLPKKIFFICFNDGPSKMMKNGFYFILKALFVLRIFKALS